MDTAHISTKRTINLWQRYFDQRKFGYVAHTVVDFKLNQKSQDFIEERLELIKEAPALLE